MTKGFLESLFARRGGIKLGLERIEAAYSQVKKSDAKIYHVAGTNGKGTVVYSLTHLLMNMGFKVGTFISPHIVDYNERIAINGKNISEGELKELYLWLEENTDNFDELSFFEITFLMAWRYFEQNGVDRMVFEVGLGGRLDASNVMTGPKTDIVTSIGLDHTRVLGDNLYDIAGEKLGIVKEGDRLFIGNIEDADLLRWMEKMGRDMGAEIFSSGELPEFVDPEGFPLSPKQRFNLGLAARAVSETEGYDGPFDFSKLALPGRFQRIGERVILDVAHNPPAIESLVSHVESGVGRVNVLFGAMRDKDVTDVMRQLGRVADKIYLIHLDNNMERGATVEEILERTPENLRDRCSFASDTEETMATALEDSEKEDKNLLVTGSFFTLEKFLRWFNG